MLKADVLIKDAYVVTVDAQRRVFTRGYVAFQGGQIVGVGPMTDCQVEAGEVIDGRQRLVLPGMANAHNHLNQVFLRGYNDDRWPVLDINAAVKTVIQQIGLVTGHMDEARSYALTRLHALEMTRAGFTATHDEHFNNSIKTAVDGSWRALSESGMRGFLCRCITNSVMAPPAGRESVDDGMVEVERLRDAFSSDRIIVSGGFVNFRFLETAEEMRAIAERVWALDMTLDIDFTDNSQGGIQARGFQGGQVEYYDSFGLMERPMYAGKAVNVRPHEFAILAERDARVSLVPMLRQFDGQGLPVHHLLALGVIPAIGTDAPMVTDNQSPFELMRHVILGQNNAVRRERGEGLATPPAEHWATSERTLEMATLGGARTLFMDDRTGSLEVGKAADCVIVRLDAPTMQPSFGGRRTLGNLVWAGDNSIVDTVYVAGRKLLEGGRSTIWDEQEVYAEAERVLAEIEADTGGALTALLPKRAAGQAQRGWTYI
jgi:5-methylthioadenosine/S-adenosylhomocysteine deaminase